MGETNWWNLLLDIGAIGADTPITFTTTPTLDLNSVPEPGPVTWHAEDPLVAQVCGGVEPKHTAIPAGDIDATIPPSQRCTCLYSVFNYHLKSLTYADERAIHWLMNVQDHAGAGRAHVTLMRSRLLRAPRNATVAALRSAVADAVCDLERRIAEALTSTPYRTELVHRLVALVRQAAADDPVSVVRRADLPDVPDPATDPAVVEAANSFLAHADGADHHPDAGAHERLLAALTADTCWVSTGVCDTTVLADALELSEGVNGVYGARIPTLVLLGTPGIGLLALDGTLPGELVTEARKVRRSTRDQLLDDLCGAIRVADEVGT